MASRCHRKSNGVESKLGPRRLLRIQYFVYRTREVSSFAIAINSAKQLNRIFHYSLTQHPSTPTCRICTHQQQARLYLHATITFRTRHTQYSTSSRANCCEDSQSTPSRDDATTHAIRRSQKRCAKKRCTDARLASTSGQPGSRNARMPRITCLARTAACSRRKLFGFTAFAHVASIS